MKSNIYTEKEICRRTTYIEVSPKLKYLSIACIVFAATLLFIAVISATKYSEWEDFFNFGYWYVYHLIFALVLIAICIFLYTKTKNEGSVSLVLTNKRIYSQISSSGSMIMDSYNLNKISMYSFKKIIKKTHTYYAFEIQIESHKVGFIIDEEFYNCFVNTINNSIYIIND